MISRQETLLTERDRQVLRQHFWSRLVVTLLLSFVIGFFAWLAQTLIGNPFNQSDVFKVGLYSVLMAFLAGLAGLLLWGLIRAWRQIYAATKTIYSGKITNLWKAGRVGSLTGPGGYNVIVDGMRFQIEMDLFNLLKVGDQIRVHCAGKNEVIDICRASSPDKSLGEEVPARNPGEKVGILGVIFGLLEIFSHC